VRLTASVGNTAKLAATLLQADATAQRIIRQTVYRNTKKQWKLARELAPVSAEVRLVGPDRHEHTPGFLRDHIKMFIEADGLIGRVGWKDKDFEEEGEPPYFRFTERGTDKMAARPCVTPARDRIKPEFDHELESNIRGGLRRMRRTG
jgi:HK97 gp10 family phage protein